MLAFLIQSRIIGTVMIDLEIKMIDYLVLFFGVVAMCLVFVTADID
jgi:hypothetical protein